MRRSTLNNDFPEDSISCLLAPDNGIQDSEVPVPEVPVPEVPKESWVESSRWYISPSSLMTWESDPEKWVVRYVTGVKDQQNAAMAVGTVFDALIKSRLEGIFLGGKGEEDWEKYAEGSLTITGEDKDLAIIAGQQTYEQYIKSPNYGECIRFIRTGNWQIDLTGDKTVTMPIGPQNQLVQIKVKPDMLLTKLSPDGTCQGVVLDWKVNGYYSKAGASVANGWATKWAIPPSNKVDNRGKAAFLDWFPGLATGLPIMDGARIPFNTANMELVKEDWAVQIGIYGMCYGWDECEWLAWIEQVAWGPRFDKTDRPLGDQRVMRVGSHRYKLKLTFKDDLRKRLWRMWEAIRILNRPLKYAGFPSVEEENAVFKTLTSAMPSTLPFMDGSDTGSSASVLEELFR